MSRSSAPSFDAPRLFSLMEAAGLDLLLVSSPHNVRYLCGGYYYPLYTRSTFTRRSQYVPFVGLRRGNLEETFFVGRPGETEVMAEEGVWIRRCFESDGISSISAAGKAAEVLGRAGARTARIGIELSALPADACEILKRELPEARFVDAVAILDALRAVKSPEEIGLLREGARRNLEALQETFEAGRDGLTTLELARSVEEAFARRGLLYLYALVCAGPDFFRAPSARRAWRRGHLLHIDAGCVYEGYIAELCRVGYLGRPAHLAERFLQNCADLEAAVLGMMKPGLPAAELQKSADELLRQQPYGEHGKFIAHGIGLVHHEDPVVHRESTAVLQAGMVLSLEMEYRHPEVGHVKIEDMAVLTPAGGELLNPAGRAWYLPRG